MPFEIKPSFRLSTSSTNNSAEQVGGRYSQGGTTDRLRNRLGWWERRKFDLRDTDVVLTIGQDEDRRPDLLAHKLYGRSTYMWIILQFNNIVDIETEFVAGQEIIVPTPRRVQLEILTSAARGRRVVV